MLKQDSPYPSAIFVLLHQDVFLRELVSNAADACDKKRFLALTNSDAPPEPMKLRINTDKARLGWQMIAAYTTLDRFQIGGISSCLKFGATLIRYNLAGWQDTHDWGEGMECVCVCGMDMAYHAVHKFMCPFESIWTFSNAPYWQSHPMQTCRLIRAPNLGIEMLVLSRQSYAMLIHVVYPSPFQQLSCVSPGAVPRCFFRPPRCSQTQGQRCWHVEGRVEGELGTHCPLRRMRAAGKWIVSFCLYIQVCWVLGSTSA